MATVTGLTADRMLAIEASSIVSGEIDEAGHLILSRHDGTQIDSGYALASTPPQIEALNVSVSDLDTRVDTLEAEPGERVQLLVSNSIAETTDITSYPNGISMLPLATGSGWSLNGGVGFVVTVNAGVNKVNQTFYHPQNADIAYRRTNHASNPGWSAWKKLPGNAVEVDALVGTWVPYTPVWTSNGNPVSIGNGVLRGSYRRVGKTCDVYIILKGGSTTGFGTGAYYLTVPFEPKENVGIPGVFRDDSALAHYPITMFMAGGTVSNTIGGAGGAGGQTVGQAAPVVWAVNDRICINGSYEVL